MIKAAFLVIGLMTVVGVALTACDDDPSEEEASSAFCSDLDALGDALDAYGDLDAQSTIDEVEEAQEDVASAYEDVLDSGADVTDARLDDLESAFDDLDASVDDVSGEDTVGEAITSIAANAQAVEAARADVRSAVNCS